MLKKVNRLRKRYQFNYTYKVGSRFSGHYMILYVTPSKTKHLKVGFAVTKKIGHAFKRNLIKRRLREIVYFEIPSLKQNNNIIIVAKDNITDVSFDMLQEDFHKLILKANLINDEKVS